MNNPQSINSVRRSPLSYNPGRGRLLDEALFFTGVASSMALPETICSVTGGRWVAFAFIVSFVIGTGWGLFRYYHQPYKVLSCLSKEPVPKAPPSVAVKLKRAA